MGRKQDKTGKEEEQSGTAASAAEAIAVAVGRQTSHNMGRCKSRGGKSQRGEEKKREDQRRERVRRKKMQVRKGRKVAIHYVFSMVCGPGGSKVARYSGRYGAIWPDEEMKNCTLLWREARVQVKTYRTHQPPSTFGSSDAEKVFAVVARARFQVKM